MMQTTTTRRGGGGGRRKRGSTMATEQQQVGATKNHAPEEIEESTTKADVEEIVIKHPLQNRWTLWFLSNAKGKSWEECLCEVTSFDTVEDFWALYNHIEAASNLKLGCDYCLFKHGVKPMWEDDKNKNGGRWLLTFNRSPRLQDVDDFWLETLLCLIGEAFDEHSDEVCGAVVNLRPRANKIAIWTGDVKKEESIKKIGQKLKERLSIPVTTAIHYQAHEDTQVKSGSQAKNRFVI